jgi:hypothetical protein
MKYMIEFAIRTAGLTYEDNLRNQEALLTAFEAWTPEEGLTVHAFLSHLSYGGYILVETDDLGALNSFASKFHYWNDIKVVPVLDVSEGVAAGAASLAWVRGVLGG